MKLLITEHKAREYTELDPVLCTELLILKGELLSYFPIFDTYPGEAGYNVLSAAFKVHLAFIHRRTLTISHL